MSHFPLRLFGNKRQIFVSKKTKNSSPSNQKNLASKLPYLENIEAFDCQLADKCQNHESTVQKVNMFNEWASKVLHSADSNLIDSKEAFKMISLLTNIDFFSIVLANPSSNQISANDCAIDDDFTFHFFEKISSLQLLKLRQTNTSTPLIKHKNCQNFRSNNVRFATKVSSPYKSEYLEFADILNEVIQSISQTIISKDNFNIYKLRATLLLLYMPNIYTSQFSNILRMILCFLGHVSELTKSILFKWLPNLPLLTKMIIKGCHSSIDISFTQYHQTHGWPIIVTTLVDTLNLIYDINQLSKDPVPIDDFVNHEINSRSCCKHCPSFPFVISFPNRLRIARSQIKELQTAAEVDKIFNGYEGRLSIKVHRESFYNDALSKLQHLKSYDFYRRMKVIFIGEAGIDAGGPKRELLRMMTDHIKENAFKLINNQFFWFKDTCSEDKEMNNDPNQENNPVSYYTALGFVLGLAIGNDVTLPIKFPKVFYSQLIDSKYKPTMKDLREIDPMMAQSLDMIIEMAKNNQDISSLELTFDANIDNYHTVPINDKMSGVIVNNDNYTQYITDYIDWIFNKRYEAEFEQIRKSFFISCPKTFLKMLLPSELDVIVSGEDEYNWKELKESAIYKDGMTNKSARIIWFWDVFYNDFNEDLRMKFLRFTTGMDKAPFGGLKSIRLKFRNGGKENKLPISHTCFNMFFLPKYQSREQLKEKLILVLHYTEGFGLV
ncbi:ubiquitin-protein ligase [Tritrichomonas foetus]|uniref:HECT-type E3 ubiquitin transferase n=1 Tax=Tritrichomonas foetus TaxID=1144522 RepID=A0A1J4J5K1_9EUKA|nr:ubiquitin-protein ligase [Tritrichomonas foetus]|eukprot:OHS92915.1 ubiquitin-protein ligase [Tritrichomonas foetus]